MWILVQYHLDYKLVLNHLYCNIKSIYKFTGVTQVEEMLVSAVLPNMSLYHLPHKQYGYSGHVIINLPRDVSTFATKFLHAVYQLSANICMCEFISI